MMEQWYSNNWNGKTNRLGEKLLQMQCQFIHHPHLHEQNTEQLATNCMSTGTTYLLTITVFIIQGAAERTPLFEKRINLKPKKIWQMFFYFWKAHRMPFYINVF